MWRVSAFLASDRALEMLHRKGVDLGIDRLGPGDQRAHQLDR